MNELIVRNDTAPVRQGSMFSDVARFEFAQRVARVFAESTMVPDQFKGNIGNCLIALNFADRIGADPFMLMQGMCIVHGKPGLEGKLIIGLINGSGRFDPLEFEDFGNLSKPDRDDDGCEAFAREKRSGKILRGTRVDWRTVKAEGWLSRNGSKWRTMAPLMFRYRAAAYFARVYCPDAILGMQTREELQDVVEMERNGTSNYRPVQQDAEPKQTLAERAKEVSKAATKALMQEPQAEPEPAGQTMAVRSDRAEADRQVSGLPMASDHGHIGDVKLHGQNDLPGPGAIDEPPPWAGQASEDPQPQEVAWGANPEDRLGDEPGKKTLRRLHKAVTARGYDKAGVKLAMRQWELHRIGEAVRRPFDVESTDDILRTDVQLWEQMLDMLVPQHTLLTMIRDKERQVPGFEQIVKTEMAKADEPVAVLHWYLLMPHQATRLAQSLDDIALNHLESGDAREPDDTEGRF